MWSWQFANLKNGKTFGVWFGRWLSVQLKEVNVSSYIAHYPNLRIGQSALYFTSLAVLFNQTPSLGSMQPYASNNARRLLAHISITCLLPGIHLCSWVNGSNVE